VTSSADPGRPGRTTPNDDDDEHEPEDDRSIGGSGFGRQRVGTAWQDSCRKRRLEAVA
jgi:hypothetical protein